MIYKSDFAKIFFGDSSLAVDKLKIQPGFLPENSFENIKQKLGVIDFMFLDQVHGSSGLAIKSNENLQPFIAAGDYLTTNQKGLAIGVLTADCVPIILVDTKKSAVGIIHAGWRGAVANVIPECVLNMKINYGTNPIDLIAYIGPHACECCYSVANDFAEKIQYGEYVFFNKENNKFYFSLIKLCCARLNEVGVKKIKTQTALCTICNLNYCSYRRNNGTALRNISLVVL
ncbi:MAG: hypothetical protein UR26_C0002G0212 [candidate division TM6 bacterium GW2011_GWF2_32_72]|nr:MAG: hypothetical protein UR26_C0002G0212 [candidate division TM6 bacterium GW2011_GWF2_32_72]